MTWGDRAGSGLPMISPMPDPDQGAGLCSGGASGSSPGGTARPQRAAEECPDQRACPDGPRGALPRGGGWGVGGALPPCLPASSASLWPHCLGFWSQPLMSPPSSPHPLGPAGSTLETTSSSQWLSGPARALVTRPGRSRRGWHLEFLLTQRDRWAGHPRVFLPCPWASLGLFQVTSAPPWCP